MVLSDGDRGFGSEKLRNSNFSTRASEYTAAPQPLRRVCFACVLRRYDAKKMQALQIASIEHTLRDHESRGESPRQKGRTSKC